jgi:peroxiredoxin Q/BCP
MAGLLPRLRRRTTFAAVSPSPYGRGVALTPGQPAPDFDLPDADGQHVSLMAFRGHPVVLYFYPAALTPGCTTQACDFRDNLDVLKGAGMAVVGISPDPPEKLRKFREVHGLPFPLLSDPGLRIATTYGAVRPDGASIARSVVLIEQDGIVVYSQSGAPGVDNVLESVR